MGLDMYAWSVSPKCSEGDFDFSEKPNVPNGIEQIHYWRKHHDLHGWMENLYRKKGGKEEFNCVPLHLRAEDLDALEQAVLDKTLPETTGFFFGNFPPDEESRNNDLYFIEKAKNEIKKGRHIYYDSWW